MPIVNPQQGQSNYDLCLECYGSLDALVRFCKENGIRDIDTPTNNPVSYDKNLVLDSNNVGFKYATKA